MSSIVKSAARFLLPRSARNWLRTPARSVRWLMQRRMIDYSFSPEWTLRCPRIASELAYEMVRKDPPQAAEFREFLRVVKSFPAPLMLDVGCHFGVFAFAALHHGGAGARVVAVDAARTAIDMMTRIAAANDWASRLTLKHVAVGRSEGELEMVDGGPQFAGFFMFPTDQPAGDRIRVRQTTIDRIVAGMDRVPDIIKLDVESFEFEALEGAVETLSRHSPILCLELHNRWMRERGVSPSVLLSRLSNLGYRRLELEGRPVDAAEVELIDLVRVVIRKDPVAVPDR